MTLVVGRWWLAQSPDTRCTSPGLGRSGACIVRCCPPTLRLSPRPLAKPQTSSPAAQMTAQATRRASGGGCAHCEELGILADGSSRNIWCSCRHLDLPPLCDVGPEPCPRREGQPGQGLVPSLQRCAACALTNKVIVCAYGTALAAWALDLPGPLPAAGVSFPRICNRCAPPDPA